MREKKFNNLVVCRMRFYPPPWGSDGIAVCRPPSTPRITLWRRERVSSYLWQFVQREESSVWPHQPIHGQFSGELRTVPPSWFSCIIWGEGLVLLYLGCCVRGGTRRRRRRRKFGGGYAHPVSCLHQPVVRRTSEKHGVTSSVFIIKPAVGRNTAFT